MKSAVLNIPKHLVYEMVNDQPIYYKGYMDHLDAATLEEFLAFNKKYYVPNNATLVISYIGFIVFRSKAKHSETTYRLLPFIQITMLSKSLP